MLKIAILFALACLCTSASDDCNEELSGDFGSIVSPGYPDEPYPNNLDCNYKITTSPNTAIIIEIGKMVLQYGNDYLNIYDGPTNQSTLIGTYTGEQSGVVIYTSTNQALIYFHTDESGQDEGFYIYFESTEPDLRCPLGNFTDDSGFLESPFFPDAYPNNTDCYYHLETSFETQMTFYISSLDIELSPDCAKDFLEIFDGEDANSKSLAKLCGSGPFHEIISSTNKALVYFHSDDSVEGPGFNIPYSINTCPGPIEYNGDFGTIYSPGYPISNYPNFANCNYTIETPPGSQVLLYINYLNLEDEPLCAFDSLRIYDGPDNTDPLLFEFCGYTSLYALTANTNEVLLEFRSDHSVSYEGFIITYVATYYYDN